MFPCTPDRDHLLQGRQVASSSQPVIAEKRYIAATLGGPILGGRTEVVATEMGGRFCIRYVISTHPPPSFLPVTTTVYFHHSRTTWASKSHKLMVLKSDLTADPYQ